MANAMLHPEARDRTASEVVLLAHEVRGMFSFFALIGSAISNGRSKVALRMLVTIGIEPLLAWLMIDGWDQTKKEETTTGWTPEVVAMGFVMGEVERWQRVQWSELAGQFALSVHPDGVAL